MVLLRQFLRDWPNCWNSINSSRHTIVSFVICKCGGTGNMFPLTDGKENRLLKELTRADGGRGRARNRYWIKGAR